MAVRRVTISMSNELFDAIEDYKFDNRLTSFSSAIVELACLGLEHAQRRIARQSARQQRKQREKESEA